MANNCLITKLKSNVNNDNLPLYGGFVVHCDGISNGTLNCFGDSAKLISKATGTETPLSSSVMVRASDLPEGDYFFVDKYKSFLYSGESGSIAKGFSFNIEDLQYYNGFDTLERIYSPNSEGVTGNLNVLPASNAIKSIVIWNTDIKFTVSTVLAHYPNIGKDGGEFNCLNLYEVDGNISDFSVLKYIPTTLYIPQSVSGDFYDAIQGDGATTGWRQTIGQIGETTIRVRCGNNAHLWSVYPTGTFKLAWTATTSSITVDGVTTTFDNSGNII